MSTGLLAVPITLFAGGIGGFVWYMNDGTWNGVIAKVRVRAYVCMCVCPPPCGGVHARHE